MERLAGRRGAGARDRSESGKWMPRPSWSPTTYHVARDFTSSMGMPAYRRTFFVAPPNLSVADMAALTVGGCLFRFPSHELQQDRGPASKGTSALRHQTAGCEAHLLRVGPNRCQAKWCKQNQQNGRAAAEKAG